MANYKHGSMNVSSQEHTFEGFIRWVIRVSVFAIGVLIFLALFNS
jgi:hypothetical protein